MQQLLSILSILVCPLMMLFCMRGMLFGHNNAKGKKEGKTSCHAGDTKDRDYQKLQIQMAELIEQNQHLSNEIQSLKQSQSQSHS
ncbi:hypothetical protein [Paenibacillus sp. MMO-177]|uniref:hypothetical protein n=1 Tax=Paenibacillus sp. MMO-177 TaxID=3081289 RepID=UPI0030167DD4